MSNRAKQVYLSPEFSLVSRLTPNSVGALAVIGLAGTAAVRLLERHFSSTGVESLIGTAENAIIAGNWWHRQKNDCPGEKPSQADQRESVVLVRRAANCWEVHVHGGRAVVRSIITGLVNAGATEVPGIEWLKAVGHPEPVHADRLAAAGGWRAAQIFSRQLAGAFAQDLVRVTRLLDAQQPAPIREAASILDRLARSARVGLQLPRPWRVLLVGPVNAGKSSLVNVLAGYSRSLVSPLAGTTRDLLEVRLLLDGWEIDLIDTAGLREITDEMVADRVEQAGMAKTKSALGEADLVIEVQPASQRRLQPTCISTLSESAGPHRLTVWSKADLSAESSRPSEVSAANEVLTSALTGEGIEQLAQRIIEILVPETKPGDDCLAYGVPLTDEQLKQVVGLQLRLERHVFPE